MPKKRQTCVLVLNCGRICSCLELPCNFKGVYFYKDALKGEGLFFVKPMPWRKLLSFILLTAILAIPSRIAVAQIPGLDQLITQTLQGVTAGQTTPAQAGADLAGSPLNTGQITAAEFTNVINNFIQGGTANATAVVGVLGAMATGAIDADMAQALSQIPNLGNITNIAGINSVLQSLGPVIEGLGPLQQITEIGSILSVALGPDGLAALANNPALQTQLAASLLSQFPALSQLGDVAQIANALGQLGQQLQNMTPAQIAAALISGLLGPDNPLGALLGALAGAGGPANSLTSASVRFACCAPVATNVPRHYFNLRNHINQEFIQHRTWFLSVFWRDNILPALMLMAEQLTATGIMQIEMIGTLLDAKHQLETQRLFQELTARAHKDYQPSEGMCQIGTASRSLAASERLSNLTQMGLTQRLLQRQTLSGDNIGVEGNNSDMASRLDRFVSTYCSPADNTNQLGTLCPAVPSSPRQNIDIDYTRNIESRLTLDVDFTEGNASPTPDEQDVFALSSNLFSHNIAPITINPDDLGDGRGNIRQGNVEKLMNWRAVIAKRSVAQNSFAAITAQRASGDAASAPYTKALIRELGVTDEAEINAFLGVNPSYFAQMEVLTKKIYQNPAFYTELYDKPANVERKGAALQAISLMQDRDLYNSLIRSEAVLSVLLETMVEKEQEKVVNSARKVGVLSD